MAGIRGAEPRAGRGAAVRIPFGALCVLSLACMLVGCVPHGTQGATHRRLRLSTDSLVSAGRFAQARSALLDVADARSAPGAAGWERAWARARAASLAPLDSLAPNAKSELVACGWPLPTSVRSDDPPDWPRLKPALERQLEVRRRLLPPGSLDLAETITALALLERSKGDGAHALGFNREALRVRVAALGADAPEVAESRVRVVQDMRFSGATPREFMGDLEQALRVRRRCFGKRSPEYCDALKLLANAERLARRTSASLRACEELLSLQRQLEGPNSVAVASALTDLAVAHLADGDYQAIEQLTGEAVAILDRHGFKSEVDYALALNMHGLALRHVGRLDEAARELSRTISVQELRRSSAPDRGIVRGRFYRLGAYGDLAAVQLLQGDSLAAWFTQERGSSRRWLERAIARGELDSAGAWDGLLTRVQAKLTDSSAVIGWLDPIHQPGSPRNPCWGYVIRRTGGVRWVTFELGSGDPGVSVRETILKLRRQLRWSSDWAFRIDRWDAIEHSRRECWNVRFAGFEPYLVGVRELVVVSPQVNYLVPIELLADDEGRSLNDRFAVRYETSALRFVHAPPPDRTSRVGRQWRALLVSAAQGKVRGSGHDPLRWTNAEIAELGARLRSPLVLSERDASEARVRNLDMSGALAAFDLVHVASHAQASAFSGAETWLALAEAATTAQERGVPPERDGLLDLDDLDRLKLNADLVTLSSCASGGSSAMLSEGAAGLGQGFIQAGARSVVCSVWPVDDAVTQRFMHYFYAALFEPRPYPCSIAEALREARVELRDHRAPDGTQPYRHPKFWGGFVLLGDGG